MLFAHLVKKLSIFRKGSASDTARRLRNHDSTIMTLRDVEKDTLRPRGHGRKQCTFTVVCKH